MKIFSLFLLMFAVGLSSMQAQIVIEESDYAELNVDYSMSVGTIDSETPISIDDYANAPWDFTFLSESATDVVTFISPSETDFSTVFPNANMVMNYQNMGLGFIDKNSSQVKLEGLVLSSDFIPMGLGALLGDGLSFNLDSLEGDDIILMEFPMEMGSEFSNSKSISDEGMAVDLLEEYGIDPSFVPEEYQAALDVLYVIITIEFSVDSEVDGYGLLSIPNAEIETLRQKNTTGIGFSIVTPTPFGNIPLLDSVLTTTSYSWYAKEEGVPVLTAQVDNEGSVSQFLYKVFENTKVEDITLNNNVKLFPNPAQDFFEISTASEKAKRICLYDVLGRKVIDQPISSSRERINVSKLSKGVYISKVLDAQGKILDNSRLSIQK